MGAIRSFDGRNCDWFTPARCPVRMVRLSVATPWPPCWLIKYTRAVSGSYGSYSVATRRGQRVLKLLRLNPAVLSPTACCCPRVGQ